MQRFQPILTGRPIVQTQVNDKALKRSSLSPRYTFRTVVIDSMNSSVLQITCRSQGVAQ